MGAVLASCLSGCWMMALQFAPVALQAAKAVGSGVVYVAGGAAQGVVRLAQHGHGNKLSDAGELTQRDRCDQLRVEDPGVIELRKNAAGEPEYRALRVAGGADDARWTPIVEEDSGPGGWRPAVNFLHMNFTPPLNVALRDTGPSYLAYTALEDPEEAPEEYPREATEKTTGQGAAKDTPALDPGATAGTFNWDGQLYQYAMGPTLPCFPPPPAAAP